MQGEFYVEPLCRCNPGPLFVGSSLSRICDVCQYNNVRAPPTFLERRAGIVNIIFAWILS